MSTNSVQTAGATIAPKSETCCRQVAEDIFPQHSVSPKCNMAVDRKSVTRTLFTGGASH
jgi:hypothetical protein